MDRNYIPELPVPIIEAALAYTKKKYGIQIDRDVLTELYWMIRWRIQQLIRARRRAETLKVSASFYAVRDWVLDQRFPQRGPSDAFVRHAYSSALGKIGNEFRKRSQPGFLLKRTELERIMERVTLDKDKRQYRLVL